MKKLHLFMADLSHQAKRKSWLNSKKLIFMIIENWPIKVLSIALALVLFVFHGMNILATRPLSVPLTIETGEALVPANSFPNNVRLTLRGEDASIRLIAEGDIDAYIDLMKYDAEGWYRAPVQIRKKGSALGVEPLEIAVNPLEVSIQLDRRISKTIPLTAVIRGRVADGYDMVSHSISPAELVVVGPRTSLNAITELYTDQIDLDGRTGDFTLQVGIINPNTLFTIRGNGIAEFSSVIVPAIPVRNIEGISIILIGLNSDFEADIGGRTGSVRLEGREYELDTFQPPINFFTVDCKNLAEPGTYTLPVSINLPRGFSLVRREPEELEITISLKETVEVEETPLSE
jgi:YbbR domain-containing protein